MDIRNVVLWQDMRTHSLAVSDDGGICYLDNMALNYGKPMYVCKFGRNNASFEKFESACAWFDWIKES